MRMIGGGGGGVHSRYSLFTNHAVFQSKLGPYTKLTWTADYGLDCGLRTRFFSLKNYRTLGSISTGTYNCIFCARKSWVPIFLGYYSTEVKTLQ